MSIQMVGWVLDQEVKDPIAKLCLISIANAHNTSTGQCNPAYSVIAHEASCERRTAIRKVKWLEENGYIEVIESKSGGLNGANKYRLIIEGSGDSLSLGGSDTQSLGSDTVDTRGSDTAVTHKEPEYGTGNKKKINKKEVPVFDELCRVLDCDLAQDVILHRKTIRKPLTERGAKLLASEFEKTGEPCRAAEIMILNGWQGFNSEWTLKRGSHIPKISNQEKNLQALAEAVNDRTSSQ